MDILRGSLPNLYSKAPMAPILAQVQNDVEEPALLPSDLVLDVVVRCSSTPVVVRGPWTRVRDKSCLVLVPNELGWSRRQELDRGLDVFELLGELRVILLLLS